MSNKTVFNISQPSAKVKLSTFDPIDCPQCGRFHKKNSYLWLPDLKQFKVRCYYCGSLLVDIHDKVVGYAGATMKAVQLRTPLF